MSPPQLGVPFPPPAVSDPIHMMLKGMNVLLCCPVCDRILK